LTAQSDTSNFPR